jgi:hypothetical protein
MLSDRQQRSGGFDSSGRRRAGRTGASVSAAGLAAPVAAGLVAAAPAGAEPAAGGAPKFTHSAKRGEFRGGRLILHGVPRRAIAKTSDGRTDRVLVERLHARLFLPGKPATGTLRHSGGKKAAFSLSRPRYSAARRTVSYRAKPVNNKPLPSVPRRFGRASLSMVAHPQVMLGDGKSCKVQVINHTNNDWRVNSSWTWNQWISGDPLNRTLPHTPDMRGNNYIEWESGNSGFDRGCGNDVMLEIVPNAPDDPFAGAQFRFQLTIAWNGPRSDDVDSCTPSGPAAQHFYCTEIGASYWQIGIN